MSRTTVPGTDARPDDATVVFLGRRELLSGIVHDMLGSVAGTDDVLRETWLCWTARGGGAPPDGVAHPRACLVRVAVNHALERRAAVGRSRQTCVGPRLPEPLVTDEDAGDPALRAGPVSLAMPVVPETLTPPERAVFVLGEVFGCPHGEYVEVHEPLDRARLHTLTARERPVEHGPASERPPARRDGG
ncbi:hypothetical protein [Streptomyces griseomycini]|uniref:DNA-directed RNA polymerase specialized sigma24 family protein n=1 Tax=Streptomyces griseomycini TaxID=66895 RepID=A0A7W7PU87_9ACTN|nr:hypothetical protein [Streptomyces griseomycini]MBB4901416.1 DNA-directed RNA polymerase specialized sigma24 family protein [Streptomyces griseomycini]GGQ14550.1 hypothetical protein GCM10010266_42270 [Streptomyces griseomycini]GGR24653.1 hypothetical protein GCM10015536_32920 [Streptomyces griseomycini]